MPAAPAAAVPARPFTDPRRASLIGAVEQAVVVAPAGPPPVAGLDGLPVADRASADHASLRPDAVGHVRRQRRTVPRWHRHRDVLRRPRPGRPRRDRARGRATLRHAAGLGRPPRPVLRPARRRTPVVRAADGRRRRRRQRLSQHLRALRAGEGPARRHGPCRPAARLRGRDRPRDRLPPPLRAVLADRDTHLHAQQGHGEADEAAAPRARAGQPAARLPPRPGNHTPDGNQPSDG